MAPSPESLYSQACNFTSFLQKGVDPRTGQYTCSIQLYEAPAQTRNCAVFQLALTFSPFSSGRSEFGRGWSLNLPYLDPGAGTIQTSTGETYRLADNKRRLRDLKLQSFQFDWNWETGEGCFRYKTGQVEVFSGKKNDRVFKRGELQKLYSSSGRVLHLVWQSTNEDRRLHQILDGTQCLVQFEYDEFRTRITTAPDTAEARTYTLTVRSGGLDKLELPAAEGQLCWDFQYNYHGPLWCIDKIDSPSGLKEEIKYREQQGAHQLPAGPQQPYPSIPNVSQHKVWPGQGQPPIITNYRYSDKNFLGYESGYQWTDDGDNLYLLAEPYNYQTTVSVGDEGNPKITTVYTYNKYHLETSSVQTQGRTSVTREITYYAKAIGYFDDQPPYYLLPAKIETTYTDRDADHGRPPRTETTSYQYDDAGNPIEEVLPDERIITRAYYGATTQDGCPGDPWGFVRYLKEETVTPAPSPHQTPTFRRLYTYQSFPTVAGAPAGYFVTAQEECSMISEEELTRTQYDYIVDLASPDHGRVVRQVDTVSNGYPVSHLWTYSRGSTLAAELTQSVASTTFDDQVVRHESTISLLTGLEKSHTNRSGVTSQFEYDLLGRVTAVTASPGTEYETTRQQAYTRVTDEIGYCLTVTDSFGVETKYFTDGLERVIRVEKQETAQSPAYRVAQERKYNEYGQCVEAVEVDWLHTSTESEPIEQRTVTQLEYDDWGQVFRQTRSDGKSASSSAILTVMDPVTLTKKEGIQDEGQVVSAMNVQGQVLQKTLFSKNGEEASTVKYEYDGLGRQVSETDHLGRWTAYELDAFDRIIKTTWPSGRVVCTKYAPQSSLALPVAIKLGSHELGKQLFDGLDRIADTTVGARTLANRFESTHTEPQQIQMPAGKQVTLSYEPQLNYAVTKVSETDRGHVFVLDKRTGAPTRLQNDHVEQTLQYTDSGLISHEVWALQGADATWSAEYKYSFSGKLQSYVDVHQHKQEIEYNSFGLARQLTLGPLRVEYTYDQAQRLSQSSSSTPNASVQQALTTECVYDDFGRVGKRTVAHRGSVLRTMVLAYGPTGLMTQRSLHTGPGILLREESFAYDEHNRLVEYTCRATEPPVDEHGHAITSQRSEFDDFDNLSKVTTTFEDGSENTATSSFENQDPTQLTRIVNTHPDFPAMVALEYDGNGALTRDEKGQQLCYDDMSRLSKVLDANGDLLCEYRYDAAGRLVTQKVPGQPDTHLFYRESTLVATQTGERQVSLVAGGPGGYWGQVVKPQGGGGVTTAQTWASDEHHSLLTWVDEDEVHHTQYTPYGFSPLASAGSPSVGFNGQWRDPITGWYHLGNGYRVYNPVLMRFHTPDPWSPFTSGEINPYAYCLGDPINRVDSSGHFSLFGWKFSWKDLLMTVVGITASVAVGVLTGGASLAIQLGVSVAVGVVADFATSTLYDVAAGDKISWTEVGIDLAFSALSGLAFGMGDAAAQAIRKPAQAAIKPATKKTASKVAQGLAKDIGKEMVVTGATTAVDKAVMDPIKGALAGGDHAADAGPGQSAFSFSASQPQQSNALVGTTTSELGQASRSSFVSRDSIRPALKESQSTLGLYPVQPAAGGVAATYGSLATAGQSMANLLNRDLRNSYGQLGDKPLHGLGAQHRIRSQYDSIRETVRRPHVAADWGSVPGLGGSS